MPTGGPLLAPLASCTGSAERLNPCASITQPNTPSTFAWTRLWGRVGASPPPSVPRPAGFILSVLMTTSLRFSPRPRALRTRCQQLEYHSHSKPINSFRRSHANTPTVCTCIASPKLRSARELISALVSTWHTGSRRRCQAALLPSFGTASSLLTPVSGISFPQFISVYHSLSGLQLFLKSFIECHATRTSTIGGRDGARAQSRTVRPAR